MLRNIIEFLFRKPTKRLKTERVVNIVWTREEWWREGFDTASVFRVIDVEHERSLTEPSEFIIEAIAVDATPLCCPLNKFLHEHGCYSAGD